MRKEIGYPIIALGVMLVIAVTAYHFLEGWDWLESAYFATATITTTGDVDFFPQTFGGKIFTILFRLAAVTTGFYALIQLSQFSRSTFENRLDRIFGTLKAKVEPVGYLRSSKMRDRYLHYKTGAAVPVSVNRYKKVKA